MTVSIRRATVDDTLRAYALRDGALVDTYTMARLRPHPA